MRIRTLAIVLASLYVAMASAGGIVKNHISVDFGPVFGPGGDGDDFGTNTVGDGTACTAGSSGPESCPLTLINDGSTGAIPLGFRSTSEPGQ